MKMRGLADRVYGDFLMPSRLAAYRELLVSVLAAGYQVVSIERYWELICDGRHELAGLVLVLRHDIDTDPGTAAAMWRIERELGIQASFFFRLSTVDVPLAVAIAGEGGHASYHYEELASIAKARRLRNATELRRFLPEARDLFSRNLARLRETTGLPMSVVASHGDFANRATGMPNWVLLEDRDFRRQAGVTLEAYDAEFMDHVTSRHSDTLHPTYWKPCDPTQAIASGERVIYLLVHPRHWRIDRLVNARDDVARLRQSLEFRLPSLGR